MIRARELADGRWEIRVDDQVPLVVDFDTARRLHDRLRGLLAAPLKTRQICRGFARELKINNWQQRHREHGGRNFALMNNYDGEVEMMWTPRARKGSRPKQISVRPAEFLRYLDADDQEKATKMFSELGLSV